MSDAPQSPGHRALFAEARRNWLLCILSTGVAATAAAIAYPIVRFLWPRPETQSGATNVVAPYRVNELRPDAEGRWPAPFNFGGKPCLLVLSGGEVKAYNAICTHTDCTVQFVPDRNEIFCACHNGVYDLNGRNVSGPPPRPLESYKVVLRGKPGQEEIIVSRT